MPFIYSLIAERKTNILIEIRAGIVTFLALAYILVRHTLLRS